MIREAVAEGRRIGVIATNRTTLEPTRQLLLAEAVRTGRQIEVELVMVEGALPALLNGDGAAHDRCVRQAVLTLGAAGGRGCAGAGVHRPCAALSWTQMSGGYQSCRARTWRLHQVAGC